MNINQLPELKQKLTCESDLAQIWLFYMNRFADYEEFTELGEPAHNDYLEAVLLQICQQMFGKKTTITDFLSIRIAEHQFFHGCFQVKNHMGSVIYFEDAKIGLLAVSEGFPTSDMIKYSRFSASSRPSKPNPYELN